MSTARPIAAALLVLAGAAVLTGMPFMEVSRFLLSSMGAGATVAPNEYNGIAEQLKRREADLDARELALTEREVSQSAAHGSRVNLLGTALVAAGVMLGVQHLRERRAHGAA